jgi:hypothetical protein
MAKQHSSETLAWAQRTSVTVSGVGTGLEATSPRTRDRDLAAFKETQRSRPLKPPSHTRAREVRS